jgi:3-carboxy-cis,cis-muconate cycloisomerase
MTDLFWPGDQRAGDVMSDAAFLAAMVHVENAWLNALVDAGVAPAAAQADLTSLVSADDAETLAAGAEADGNPAIGLVALLRERTGGETARWVHRGLTSQDIIDTALMLCLREALSRIRSELTAPWQASLSATTAAQCWPALSRSRRCPAPSARRWPTGSPACSTPPTLWRRCPRCPCNPEGRPEPSPPQPN